MVKHKNYRSPKVQGKAFLKRKIKNNNRDNPVFCTWSTNNLLLIFYFLKGEYKRGICVFLLLAPAGGSNPAGL